MLPLLVGMSRNDVRVTVMPIERAVPAMIFSAASRSLR